MNSADFHAYWKPVRNRLLSLDDPFMDRGTLASRRLANLLGETYRGNGDWSNLKLTEEMKSTLALLRDSPHFDTLIKVMEIRSKHDKQNQE